MNQLPQQFSPRVGGLEVLLDADKSQLVRYRGHGNAKLAPSTTPEMPLDVDDLQLSLDEGLPSAPHQKNSDLGPEIPPEESPEFPTDVDNPTLGYEESPEFPTDVDNPTLGCGESPEIPLSCDNSKLVCYEDRETSTHDNESQLGANDSSQICPYAASSQSLMIGPLEDEEEDNYQSGVQIVEIHETPREVPKVTRDRAEINMRIKRWEEKLNAYKALLARNHELYAIYEEKRLAVAAGLAEIAIELDELDKSDELDLTSDDSLEGQEGHESQELDEIEEGQEGPEDPEDPEDPENCEDGCEMVLVNVQADEEPESSEGGCSIC